MIDRLKADCQEYEQTIVDQHKEISELKKLLAAQNGHPQKAVHKTAGCMEDLEQKSLVKRLQSEIKSLRD